MNHKKDAVIP